MAGKEEFNVFGVSKGMAASVYYYHGCETGYVMPPWAFSLCMREIILRSDTKLLPSKSDKRNSLPL